MLEFKNDLEKDDSYVIYEIDAIDEYQQLIGILDFSITFSTDLKKTQSYLELCRKSLNKRQHLNIFINKQTPSGLVQSRMEKNGLNECLADYTQIKTLQFKVNVFFKGIQPKHDENLQTDLKSKKEMIDTISKQRLERLIDDVKSSIKTKDLVVSNQITGSDFSLRLPFFAGSEIQGRFKNNVSNNSWKWKEYSFNPIGKILNTSIQTKIEVEKVGQLSGENEVESLIGERKTLTQSEDEILEEVIYFPGNTMLDPIVFFLELVEKKVDSEYKIKFLKMTLKKLYNVMFYFADDMGCWEEGTPKQVCDYKISDLNSAHWDQEGRNEIENLFFFPVFFDKRKSACFALVIPGYVAPDKMPLWEFWANLGKSACS